MTLAQLVDIRARLLRANLIQLEESSLSLQREVNAWQSFAAEGDIKEELDYVIRTFHTVDANVLSMKELVKSVLDKIENQISKKSEQYLWYGYKIGPHVALGPTMNADVDYKYRYRPVDDSTKDIISTKIMAYSSWQYPSLEIGPGAGFWTDYLVSGDPLYLVDIHQEYLDKVLGKYNEKYSKKLRPYLIGPENGCSDLDVSMLPENQIGFVFSWNVFDYIPWQQLKIYLESIYKAMRPGGVLLFSYNNCEKYNNAVAVEHAQRSWMPKHLLEETLKDLKFEIINFGESEDRQYDFVECKKGGQLQSIRTAQPKFTIHTRPGFEIVDKGIPKTYNKQQVIRLQQLAIKMGIDSPDTILSGKYEPHLLEEMINSARTKR